MGNFVSLKDDVSFKYLFLNETVRRHFISDVLGIPTEEIRSVRLANTFLWSLFNAQTEEELDMLNAKTKNPGIAEAIREVKEMRLGKTLKALYDAHMKQIRDRNARDDYVRMEGLAAGEDRVNRLVLRLIKDGRQEDIEKAARDEKYREKLFKEYEI